MNTLKLAGKLKHVDGEKFIYFVTTTKREYLLPINALEDFDEDEWVIFDGVLVTNYRFDITDNKNRKCHFGDGHLRKGSVGFYKDDLQLRDVVLSHKNELRVTPLTQRKILDFVLGDGGLAHLNCIAFGKVASEIENKSEGYNFKYLRGKFQSRKYMKGDQQKVAYEVLINCID